MNRPPANITGNGFVPPLGSTPVRKAALRDAANMIERGAPMHAAIDAIYEHYIGETIRETGVGETSDRNCGTIEKGIGREMKRRANAVK